MNIVKKTIKNGLILLVLGALCPLWVCAMENNEINHNNRKFDEIEKSENTTEPNKKPKLTEAEKEYIKPILIAIDNGDEEKIKEFIQKNDDNKINILNKKLINYTNSKNNASLLLIALQKNQLKIASLLIDSDTITLATLNAQDENGNTVLMFACQNNFIEIVELLLAKGADPNLQLTIDGDSTGATALIFSCQNNFIEIVELLLAKGADPNLQLTNGKTALMITCIKGLKKIVELLLETKGANLNLQEIDGRTALMITCIQGFPEITNLLIEKGANLNLQEIDGRTALMILIDVFLEDTTNLLMLDTIKTLLYNNATYSNETYRDACENEQLEKLFDEIHFDGLIPSNNDEISASQKEKALYCSISFYQKTSKFTKYEWLTLALLNNHAFLNNHDKQVQYRQIQWCIDKKIITEEDVTYQELYLKHRGKTSKELLVLGENSKENALNILNVIARKITNIHIDATNHLLEGTSKLDREQLMITARKHNNKELGRKIITFTKAMQCMNGKNEDKKGILPSELTSKIASYL